MESIFEISGVQCISYLLIRSHCNWILAYCIGITSYQEKGGLCLFCVRPDCLWRYNFIDACCNEDPPYEERGACLVQQDYKQSSTVHWRAKRRFISPAKMPLQKHMVSPSHIRVVIWWQEAMVNRECYSITFQSEPPESQPFCLQWFTLLTGLSPGWELCNLLSFSCHSVPFSLQNICSEALSALTPVLSSLLFLHLWQHIFFSD